MFDKEKQEIREREIYLQGYEDGLKKRSELFCRNKRSKKKGSKQNLKIIT